MEKDLVEGTNDITAETGQENQSKKKYLKTLRDRKERRGKGNRERKETNGKNNRWKIFLCVIAAIALCTIVILVKKYMPSNEIMDLSDYYSVPQNEVLVVLNDEISEVRGLYDNNTIYVDYNTVIQYFNKRFFWDSSENILSYATATEIIRTEVGKKEYSVNKSKSSVDYQIIKTNGENIYIALDYVKLFSNIEYQFYPTPNRVVIQCKWGEKFHYHTTEKKSAVRYEPDIKSKILEKVEKGTRLLRLNMDTPIDNGFIQVMTEDGVIGYVKENHVGAAEEKTLENQYKKPVYPHIKKDKIINMVWDQVTNQVANEGVLNRLASTKGVNVISPTWFKITSTKGTISSIASENYVEHAHNAGVEVWALCSDFADDGSSVNMTELLSNTTTRDKLVNELIANVIKYNLDGLNIDFEKITKESAAAYLQFLRELSVRCRNNGIVLSVDSYVPSAYTEYYDRKEQGEIVDYVIVMTYDEHYAGSKESGSVSSIGFVKKAVSDILEMVPADQVIIALPFYTRIWKETNADGETKITSGAYGMSSAQNVLSQNGVTPKWDDTTGQYYGEYKTSDAVYKVWLEEEKSFEQKLKVVFPKDSSEKIAGVAAWKLGLEKPEVWNTIMKYVN